MQRSRRFFISNSRDEEMYPWPLHERLWFAAIILIALLRAGWNWYTLSEQKLEGDYLKVYAGNGLVFTNYATHVFFPQIVTLLTVALSYAAINFLIIPTLKKFKSNRNYIHYSVLLLLQAVGIIALILVATNTCAWFANPFAFNRGFHFTDLLWYKDAPLPFVFNGFRRAAGSAATLLFIAVVREVAIYYLKKSPAGPFMKTKVVNHFTAFIFSYLTGIYLLSATGIATYIPLFPWLALLAPSFFILFIINLYFLFPWKDERRASWFQFFIRLIVISFACTFPFFLFRDAAFPHQQFILFLYSWAVQLFIVAPVSRFIYKGRKEEILQLRTTEKKLRATENDLRFLRSQINPHFLFNTLNTIYGLALREKSPETARAIQQLGDMMRFTLQENTGDFIETEKEIAYLKNYIALQEQRYKQLPDTVIESTIDARSFPPSIPHMILIPLAENAFKHGILPGEKSWVKIKLTCTEDSLQFEVRNSKFAVKRDERENESFGIGLKNVSERLQLLYGEQQKILAEETEREFKIQLFIHVNQNKL